jgi:parvulin-like peptidyl-prolyl isomerase
MPSVFASKIIRLFGCAALCALVFACSKPAPKPVTGLAQVGDQQIMPEDLIRQLQKQTGNLTPEIREAALQSLIRQKALLSKARAAGFDRDPETAARIEQFIASAYEEKLRGPDATRTNSLAEVEAYYKEHAGEFIAQERIRVATILVRVPKKADDESRARFSAQVEKVHADAAALPSGVKDLGELAQKNSEDQSSRYRGGDLGWMNRAETEGRFGPKLAATVFDLKNPGELSPVLSDPDGLHIFKLIERQSAHPKPIVEVRDLIAYRIAQGKKLESDKAFEQKIRSDLRIEVNRQLLDQVAPITNAPAAPPRSPGA